MAPMEEFKVTSDKVIARVKELIKEGNVRRIVLKNPEGRVLIDVPLNAGIASAALLPLWTAIGAVLVLATDYTVLVERDADSALTKRTAP